MGLSPSLSRSALLQSIWETVPAGTQEPIESKVLAKLSELTSDLIDICGRNSLKIDPFSEVYQRRVAIDLPKVSTCLTDKVILITGGQGFVGTNLIAKLQEFGVKKIVSVDISADRSQRVAIAVAGAHAPEVSSPRELLVGSPTNCTQQRDKTDGKPYETTSSDFNVPVAYYHGDVRDSRSLQAIFDIEQPQIVFHLAAERLPGLAEIQIHQTVSTNILGCDNIIKLCEANRVEACIFSSTGKASRYFTPDIYAASKKIAEWLFSDYSQPKACQYGIVRFTHVVENSPVSADLDERVANGIVSMHAPDRYIYTQNIEETIGLLLNALTILEPGRTKLLAVKDLGWPINTLDLALYKIVRSGRDIPLYFKGLPAGYERHVFLGQLDLSGKKETLPMLNVLEADNSKISPAGDTVISQIVPFDDRVLARCLTNIKRAIVSTDAAIKQTVIAGEKEVALSSFLLADAARLDDIITWGTNTQEMSAAGVDIHYHRDTLELLSRGMSSTKVTIAPSEVTTTESIPVTISVPNENIDRERVKKFSRVKQHIDLVQKMA